MADDMLMAVFVMGIVFLGAAVFVPQLIDATQQDVTQTLNISEGETNGLTDYLSVEPLTVNASGDNATVRWIDEASLNTTDVFLNVSETNVTTLSGETVRLGLESITNNATVANYTHPPMFGWNSGAQTFVENIGLIFAGLGGILIFGPIFGVVSREL